MTDDPKLVKMFKALSNENRFRLFVEILRSPEAAFEDGGCSIAHIMERLSIGAPTVSHHLKELVNADLVRTERDGKFVRCRVNEDALKQLEGFFSLA